MLVKKCGIQKSWQPVGFGFGFTNSTGFSSPRIGFGFGFFFHCVSQKPDRALMTFTVNYY
jgi:hypothetical protein